jgi:hypothetical protein
LNSTAEITTDPLLFDKLLAPLDATLQTLDAEPRSQAAKKLTLRCFARVLLFRLFAQCGSLGNLVLDLRTKREAHLLGLPVLGLATIHDAFVRYPHAWFVALTQAVLRSGVLLGVPELEAFGPLWCVDSSWWPLVRQLGWLQRDGYQGVRLHLGLSLNLVCPAAFLLSYDKSPTSSERANLLALVTAGVTYLADRGDVSLPLYRDIMEARAFFVIRERHNLRYRVLVLLDVTLDGLSSATLLGGCRDEIIQLTRDEAGTVLRLVSFRCGTHAFRLVTNRFDLTTAQIIRLYAWRWQVEEMFSDHKSRGLDLEATRLSDPDRLERLLVAVSLAYLWVLQIGFQVTQTGWWRQVDNRGHATQCEFVSTRLALVSRGTQRRTPPTALYPDL